MRRRWGKSALYDRCIRWDATIRWSIISRFKNKIERLDQRWVPTMRQFGKFCHTIITVVFSLLVSQNHEAKAFPQFSGDGYFSCTSCHVSSSGGDTLTAYGRSFAEEKLTTWVLRERVSLYTVASIFQNGCLLADMFVLSRFTMKTLKFRRVTSL